MRFCAAFLALLLGISSLFAFDCKEECYWGYHLSLDCKSCDVQRITDAQNLRNFVKDLVVKIDMKAYGEPVLEHFAEHNPEAAGFSLMQLIETSSITGHFVDQSGDAYIDIFSCKPFDVEKAKAVVREYLNPQRIHMLFLYRQA